MILIIISLPIIIITNALVSQTQVAYTLSRRAIVSGNIFYGHCTDSESLICEIINPVQDFMQDPKIKYYLEDGLKKMTNAIIDKATNFIFAIPKRILDFFIMLFAIYYLLKDGSKLVDKIKKMLPVNKATCNLLMKRMKSVFYAMIYGYFFIALIQGILGGIGFFAVGLSSPVLWGLVMALFSLLPVFGTALIWVPASLYLIIIGIIENNPISIWKGIALFAYGFAIVSSIDNVLRPKIVSKKADIHPVVVLIGVVGGMQLLGFIGLIIGPIVLVILITLFSMYEKMNHDNNNNKKKPIKKGRKK